MKNEYKEVKKEKKAPKKRRERSGESRVGKAVRSILDGSILTRQTVVRLVPYFLFLTLICVLYIANTYYAEKTIRQSIRLRKEIKDLESDYLSTKSELMMCSRQSELAEMLDTIGVVESLTPPVKIFVNGEKNEQEKP
jgi:hypothetical protein